MIAIENYRLVLPAALALIVTGCSQPSGDSDAATDTASAAAEVADAAPGGGPEVVEELIITDIETGDGDAAEAGKNIIVHYTGWLYDPTQPGNKGNKFDSSVDRGQPFVFPLGAGRVIQGWDQGFDGMQIGGKRVLIIPPEMGYGARGAGSDIPPNSTLLFEVELLGIQ